MEENHWLWKEKYKKIAQKYKINRIPKRKCGYSFYYTKLFSDFFFSFTFAFTLDIYNNVNDMEVEYKEGNMPLTIADRAANEIIVSILKESFPEQYPI